MSRRSKGEGSIYQRKDGRWAASVRYTDPATGEPARAHFYGRTKTEVRKKLKAAIARVDDGAPVRDAEASVGKWLAEWRVTALEASTRKVTTKRNYAALSRKHLEADPFGGIPLGRLRASDVDRLMLQMRDAGYADATRQRVFNVLRIALSDAKRDGLIARNPMDDMHQPKVERKEAVFLSPADTRRVLEASEGSRYHAVLSTIAALGLRKGEALALTWDDVDLDAGTLRVRGTLSRIDKRLVVTEPKTAKSRRTLALSPGMVFLLSVHRDLQQIERERAGNQWVESGHVFTTELGGPLEPSNVLRALKAAAEKAGVEGVTVHTLRHSAATTMLEAGVNLKAVSDLLGHADIRITADVYGHVSPELAREAMGTLSERIGL